MGLLVLTMQVARSGLTDVQAPLCVRARCRSDPATRRLSPTEPLVKRSKRQTKRPVLKRSRCVWIYPTQDSLATQALLRRRYIWVEP